MQARSYFLIVSILLVNGYGISQIPELNWPIAIISQDHGFTEGPVVAPDGQIFFSDMDQQLILQYNPASGTTGVWQSESRKSNGLFIHDNYLYACEAGGRSVVRYDLSIGPISREVLVSKFQEDTLISPNDLTIIGNILFFSDFGGGRAYSLSLTDHSIDSIPFNYINPNGIVKSHDGKLLYVADFGADKLYRAELIDGQVGTMQLIIDLKPYELSSPDGLAVSKDGHIFLALYRSDRLVVIAPDGTLIGYLPTGPLTSNCVIAENGELLYITADKKLKRVNIPHLPYPLP